MPPKLGGAPKCSVCGKSAYLNESITFNNVLYHDVCFQCKMCGGRIAGYHLATEQAGELFHKNCAKKLPLVTATPSSAPSLETVPSPPSLVPPPSPHSALSSSTHSQASSSSSTSSSSVPAVLSTPATTHTRRAAHLTASAPRRPPPPPPRDGMVPPTPQEETQPQVEEEEEESSDEDEEEEEAPVKKIEWTCEGPQGGDEGKPTNNSALSFDDETSDPLAADLPSSSEANNTDTTDLSATNNDSANINTDSIDFLEAPPNDPASNEENKSNETLQTPSTNELATSNEENAGNETPSITSPEIDTPSPPTTDSNTITEENSATIDPLTSSTANDEDLLTARTAGHNVDTTSDFDPLSTHQELSNNNNSDTTHYDDKTNSSNAETLSGSFENNPINENPIHDISDQSNNTPALPSTEGVVGSNADFDPLGATPTASTDNSFFDLLSSETATSNKDDSLPITATTADITDFFSSSTSDDNGNNDNNNNNSLDNENNVFADSITEEQVKPLDGDVSTFAETNTEVAVNNNESKVDEATEEIHVQQEHAPGDSDENLMDGRRGENTQGDDSLEKADLMETQPKGEDTQEDIPANVTQPVGEDRLEDIPVDVAQPVGEDILVDVAQPVVEDRLEDIPADVAQPVGADRQETILVDVAQLEGEDRQEDIPADVAQPVVEDRQEDIIADVAQLEGEDRQEDILADVQTEPSADTESEADPALDVPPPLPATAPPTFDKFDHLPSATSNNNDENDDHQNDQISDNIDGGNNNTDVDVTALQQLQTPASDDIAEVDQNAPGHPQDELGSTEDSEVTEGHSSAGILLETSSATSGDAEHGESKADAPDEATSGDQSSAVESEGYSNELELPSGSHISKEARASEAENVVDQVSEDIAESFGREDNVDPVLDKDNIIDSLDNTVVVVNNSSHKDEIAHSDEVTSSENAESSSTGSTSASVLDTNEESLQGGQVTYEAPDSKIDEAFNVQATVSPLELLNAKGADEGWVEAQEDWEEPEIYRDRDEELPPNPAELVNILSTVQTPLRASSLQLSSVLSPQPYNQGQTQSLSEALGASSEGKNEQMVDNMLGNDKNSSAPPQSLQIIAAPQGKAASPEPPIRTLTAEEYKSLLAPASLSSLAAVIEPVKHESDPSEGENLRVLHAAGVEELGSASEALKSARKESLPSSTPQKEGLPARTGAFDFTSPVVSQSPLLPERSSLEDVQFGRRLSTQSLPTTPLGHFRGHLSPDIVTPTNGDVLSPWQLLQQRERSQSTGTHTRAPVPWNRAQSFPGNLVDADGYEPPKVQVFNILTLSHRRERSEIVYETSGDGVNRGLSMEDLGPSPEKVANGSSNSQLSSVANNVMTVDGGSNANRMVVHTMIEEDILPDGNIIQATPNQESQAATTNTVGLHASSPQVVIHPTSEPVSSPSTDITTIHKAPRPPPPLPQSPQTTPEAGSVVMHTGAPSPPQPSLPQQPPPPLHQQPQESLHPQQYQQLQQPQPSSAEQKVEAPSQSSPSTDPSRDSSNNTAATVSNNNNVKNEEQESLPMQNIGELKFGEVRKLGLKKPSVSQKKLADYEQKINSRSNRNLALDLDGFVSTPRKVTVLKNPGTPLGMTVVAAAGHTVLPGVLVADLATGGPAASTGLINRGDHLLMINGFSTVGATVSKVMELIRGVTSIREVILELLSPDVSIPRFLSPPRSPACPPKNVRPDFYKNADPQLTAMYMQPENSIKFVLKKAIDQPLGIGIAATLPDAVVPGVFVSHVDPKGVAAADTRDHPFKLMHGDQLMVVNGQSMTGKTFAEAKAVLRECAKTREVRFEIVRTHKAVRHVLNGGPHGLVVDKGVIVSVARGSEGDKAMFEPGQRILTISGLSMYPAPETLERYLRSDPPLIIWTILPLSVLALSPHNSNNNPPPPLPPLPSSPVSNPSSPSDVVTPPSPLAPVGYLPSPVPWAIPVPPPTTPAIEGRPVRLQFGEVSP